MDNVGASHYLHRDGIGSIVNVTSATGATEWSYSYEPYGAAKTATQNDPAAPTNSLRFAGEYLDSTSGLTNLRARQYDTTSGRFLSTDPLAASAGDPVSSSYVYGNNNPLAFIDPSGMGAVWDNGGKGCSGFLASLRCVGQWAPSFAARDLLGWRDGCERSTMCLLAVTANVGSVLIPEGRAGKETSTLLDGGYTTFMRDAAGRVKSYTTFRRSDPRDPEQFRWVRRFDRDGKGHYNKATDERVPTPHVHDKATPGGVRPPYPGEIPK